MTHTIHDISVANHIGKYSDAIEVGDLVQPRAEQITRSCRLVLLRPHRSLRCGNRIMLLDSGES